MKAINLFALLFLVSTAVKTNAQTTAYAQVKGEEIELLQDPEVKLKLFEGICREGKNYLHWNTTNQQADGLYIIYRSFDGITYEAIGTKTGVGVPISKAINYYFTDETLALGNHSYYRIIHIGNNKTFLLSETIIVDSDAPVIAGKN